MLSAHEFSTLMLIERAPYEVDLDRAKLEILYEYRFAIISDIQHGRRRAFITSEGKLFLKAFDHTR